MKILTAAQIREADLYTIKHLPIASIDLMEKAAKQCYEWISVHCSNIISFHVVCGQGNNGGDGLALARLLIEKGNSVKVSIVGLPSGSTTDFDINLGRLKSLAPHIISEIRVPDELDFKNDQVIIDALLGTGISRKPEGLVADIIRKINTSQKKVISIDLPSGLFADKSSHTNQNEIVKASFTLTFQYLKPALVIPENASLYGQVEILDIGLLSEAENEYDICFFQTESSLIKTFFLPRNPFSHKGTYGHALLFAGNRGKMGAAILAAGACLRSGTGLLTMLIPESGEQIIQVAVPEAMSVTYDDNQPVLPDLSAFKAVGAGPGIGTGSAALKLLDNLLDAGVSLVLDADALNLISMNPGLLQKIKPGTILTPHPGEFKRLAGPWKDDFEKLDLQRELSEKFKIHIVLKGKNTTISTPEGHIWFNPTGNPGMAKGGSGDILTGLITGLAARGLKPLEACITGTWLHGMAGDCAAEILGQEAMNAGDIIRYLPAAWNTLLH